MVNVLMYASFDGKNFSGWQVQREDRTVQGEIEKGIEKITGEKVRIIGCGRTDSGVHAKRYAFNFKFSGKMEKDKLVKGLNAVLPEDIGIIKSEYADEDFHARFSPHYKIYSYTIINYKVPILLPYSYYVYKLPDVEFLTSIAKDFVGKYDGTSFCVAKSVPENPWIHIEDITVNRIDFGVRISFKGRRFLHNTIRIIVGTMIDIYNKKISLSVKDIIEARNRDSAGFTVPAHGLCLEDVVYEKGGAR